jgi:hypothetical protein
MPMLMLSRTLQALILPLLLYLVFEWVSGPKYSHLAYFISASLLSLIALLVDPRWTKRPRRKDKLLERPRHIGMAILIYSVFLITGIPLVSIWAVLWAGMSIYAGGLLILDGQLAQGFILALVPLLGLVGLYTLWALARYYVRLPRNNPPRVQLTRLLTGLFIGVCVFVFIWTIGDIWKWGDLAFAHVAFLGVPPLIVTALFLLLMFFNWVHPSRSNPSLNPDALKRAD